MLSTNIIFLNISFSTEPIDKKISLFVLYGLSIGILPVLFKERKGNSWQNRFVLQLIRMERLEW